VPGNEIAAAAEAANDLDPGRLDGASLERSLARAGLPSFVTTGESIQLCDGRPDREQREQAEEECRGQLAHADILAGPLGSRRSRVATKRARPGRLRPQEDVLLGEARTTRRWHT